MADETTEEKVQLQTVNHRWRTAFIFGVIAGIIATLCMGLAFK